MSDEHVENAEVPQGSDAAPEMSRKEKAATRRAEFEAAKEAKASAKAEQQAVKNAEKAAMTAAAREEKLAAKQAHADRRAAAKEAKDAAKAAKKAAKTAAVNGKDDDTGDTSASEDGVKKAKQGKQKKQAKQEKDPYRPRFVVAPVKVRAFTILVAAFACIHTVAAVLLVLETTSAPVLGVVPTDVPSTLVYVAAAVSLVVAALWTVSASLLCAGRVRGKHLGIAALVLGLPLSPVAAPLLFSDDVRNWAL